MQSTCPLDIKVFTQLLLNIQSYLDKPTARKFDKTNSTFKTIEEYL